MVYVIMFWGLFKWMSYPFRHKTETKCECVYIREDIPIITEENVNEIAYEEAKPVIAEKKEENKKVEVKKTKSNKYYKVGTNTYQDYAYDLVINQYAWSEEDFKALVKLWEKESGWNPNVVNKSSGACNIPQALPCNKISKMYGDNSWESGIKWGLTYINDRYGTPTKAWKHFQNKNWY